MDEHEAESATNRASGEVNFLRRRWWVFALLVLAVLLGIIYLLSHLSAADSEMYPTTMLRLGLTHLYLC